MTTRDDSTPIEYRYLNMDTEKFVETQEELSRDCVGGIIRAVPNYKHNQVLIAASCREFTEMTAILLCRKVSGLNKS